MSSSSIGRDDLKKLFEGEWDESLVDPVANAENKLLDQQVLQKRQLLAELRNLSADHEERIKAMCDHLKNVRLELTQTQSFHAAKQKEYETENHLKSVDDREAGRMQQDLRKFQSELATLKERENSYENQKFRLMQQLEELGTRMDWDQQALQSWLEETARKDEDAMFIEKYSRQDEAKIKELNGQIGHRVAESQKKKRQLDHQRTETQMTQLELDKTAEEFRKTHLERHELLSRWQDTIDQIQKRDTELEILSAQLAKLRSDARNKEAQLKQKEEFHKNEIANNKELEKKISLTERFVTKLKQDLEFMEKERDRVQNELEVMKRMVDRTASDLEQARAKIKQYKKEIATKQERMEALVNTIASLQQKLKDTIESKLSADEKSKRMEDVLKHEESYQSKMMVEVKGLTDILFRRNNELFSMKENKRSLENEIQGLQGAMRNYNSKIIQLDQETFVQLTVIYNQNYNIQTLERRIGKLSGEASNEEVFEMDTKIKELTKDLKDKTDTHEMLKAQNKRVQENLRRIKFSLERTGKMKEKVTEKIEDINLHLENAQKASNKVLTNKQNLMVDLNVMKLEVKRKRDALYKSADGVMSLEKTKLHMESIMKERREEIKVHNEMLTAQIRIAHAERQTTSSNLRERIANLAKLKRRYEVLMGSAAGPDGEEEKSQAFYVIKAAQEKEELQREGDSLDASIRKAQKEIRALENTVRLVTNRNDSFRRNLNTVGESSDEMEQKQRLEEELRAVNDKYRFKRRQVQELRADLELMNTTMENLSRDENAYNESLQNEQNRLIRLQKDLDEQRAKLERASKMNAKYAKEIRGKSSRGETSDERDFEIRIKQNLNKQAIKQMGDIVQQIPELAGPVHLYLSQANIPLVTSNERGTHSVSSASRSSSSSTQQSLQSSSLSSARSSDSGSSQAYSGRRAQSGEKKPVKAITIGGDLFDGRSGSSHSSSSVGSSKSASRR